MALFSGVRWLFVFFFSPQREVSERFLFFFAFEDISNRCCAGTHTTQTLELAENGQTACDAAAPEGGAEGL